MKILITGNMGYVGPGVVAHLRSVFPQATLIGYDMAYFANCLTNADFLPESKLDEQLFGDIRNVPASILEGVDAVVHLAAVSNDPMGNKYEEVTIDVNHKSSIALAEKAKAAGVKSFIFASSCSVYGAGGEGAKTEDSELNPLTAYARSKIFTERDLKPLADSNFTITCLRFATACGMSNRLRLDLVLNDFVAGAVTSKQITILSDGTPWRPLINVKDMAIAIEWAIERPASNGGEFLAINTGSNVWNYQVKEIAEAVAQIIPGTQVSINQEAPPDKRSYRVNFDLYAKLAPNHQVKRTLIDTIEELKENLEAMGFADGNFRNSQLMRLKVLNTLQDKQLIDSQLVWAK
ncbi:NAD-dependent epimerase/dehydratase [Cytophagaceae bacterium DM2B3-1]|uniref:NAD-dependent epimerase/dehydratase n=1 Tax=Xanthocytophaga flava TaxID=3048013 RepID=A0AAE3QWU7_9BACT|nr:NAD-dependent epimerase/dehydratase [Xanthocytophaga flavus]MDJ1472929.1 NAD-dependent epimerase/dehydratase [Xanthocytophaga flavus]MDJ1483953.1 NAD-dependent epimerase/dehydratase [Xanthocytophaga flavus]MDJ1492392.1 NAD-dependent epimerase/dehydratase [Xanthocytophaga flavus]